MTGSSVSKICDAQTTPTWLDGPLEALADKELSVAALRQAAERGRLRAQRTRSGTWQSSRQWVDTYKASRYGGLRAPRGPRSPGL